MTSKLIIALLSILIGFSACNDDNDEVEMNGIPMVKRITYYLNDQMQSQLSFEYDEDERLVLKTYTSGDWVSYTYEAGSVIEKTYLSNFKVTQVDTILLNNIGLAIYADNSSDFMEYDDEGYLIKKTTRSVSKYTFFYKIKNGNMVEGSMMADDVEQTLRVMETNQFLPNTTNTIGDENMGLSFWGKQDKELVSTIQYSQGPLITITYEYDSENRVSKFIGSNGRSAIYTYY